MISKQESVIALLPFVREFTAAVIKTIRADQNISGDDRTYIHADMVPKFSEKVIQASLGERKIPMNGMIASKELVMEPIVEPLKKIIPVRPVAAKIAPSVQPPRRFVRQIPQVMHQQIQPPIMPGAQLTQEYGKITPLLHDPSISSIECQGEGKQIMVIRMGQRQITKIILTKKEIDEILNKVSDSVNIPLLEGVFRAAVDNFSINAVISDIIGSRFVIKKQTQQMMPRGYA